MKPLIIDYCCGVGGASAGYVRAGYEVVGVDSMPQPNYPYEFVRADFRSRAARLLLRFADAVHISPPCQRWTMNAYGNGNYGDDSACPDLITDARRIAVNSGLPYVIENVNLAPLVNPVVLCGTSFGLCVRTTTGVRWLKRHRYFESNVRLVPPSNGCKCGRVYCGAVVGSSRNADDPNGGRWYRFGYNNARRVMGIPWARTYGELREAIPPAYTEWIGRQLMKGGEHDGEDGTEHEAGSTVV